MTPPVTPPTTRARDVRPGDLVSIPRAGHPRYLATVERWESALLSGVLMVTLYVRDTTGRARRAVVLGDADVTP